jgi:Ribosomal protein L7/L12 C-terminal domain.
VYLEPEVIEELEQGSLINAIKILRAKRSISLKEAKNLIEEYLEINPYLRSKTNKTSSRPLLILALAFLVYTLYRIFILD